MGRAADDAGVYAADASFRFQAYHPARLRHFAILPPEA